MSILSGLYKKTKYDIPVSTDIHSHLIAGIDDGSKSIEESLDIIKQFAVNGYKKLITTPHIMSDYYKNSPENILPGLEELKVRLKQENINIEIEAAAEYYLDEFFIEIINNNQPLMTFGNNYVLFETSFMNKPRNLEEVIFLLSTKGYKPVLAHPERYIYLANDFSSYEELKSKGVLFQLNYISLSGYYSPVVKKTAEKLVDAGLIDMIGSDCHGQRHLDAIEKTKTSKYMKKLAKLPLLNNSL